MAKHTEGPWTMNKPGMGKVLATIPIVYDSRGNAVAHVLGGLDAARLIAAAPEMLEALRALLKDCEPFDDADIRTPSIAKCQIARAAIAKAEEK